MSWVMSHIPHGDQQEARADCEVLILLCCLLCPFVCKEREPWTASPSWGSQLSDRVLPSFASWFPNICCEDEGRHSFPSRNWSEMSCWDACTEWEAGCHCQSPNTWCLLDVQGLLGMRVSWGWIPEIREKGFWSRLVCTRQFCGKKTCPLRPG